MTSQAREAEFWDRVVARGDTVSAVGPDDLCDPSVPWFKLLDLDVFVQRLIGHLQIRPGTKILDLGCGQGFLSAALALRGAIVQGIDISPLSIDYCRRRAELSGIAGRASFSVMDCQALDFEDASFDAVCGCFVLHHLDLERVAAEIGRVLRPGGRAAFIETLGLNPLLMLARATLPGRGNIEKASSEDEYPLDRARLARLRQAFPGRMDTGFPRVVFFRMGGYLPALNNAVGRPVLRALDRALGAVPGTGPLSYYGLVTMQRGDAAR